MEELRDPEIEQADAPLVGHENIRWLEVAMDDQVRMRVLHRSKHLPKEQQPLAQSQPPGVAVRPQWRAGDVLECKIGLAILGEAGVVKPCDVGMIQLGENRPLAGQAVREPEAHECRMDELESDLTRKETIDALGEPDGAHTTLTQERADAVR